MACRVSIESHSGRASHSDEAINSGAVKRTSDRIQECGIPIIRFLAINPIWSSLVPTVHNEADGTTLRETNVTRSPDLHWPAAFQEHSVRASERF